MKYALVVISMTVKSLDRVFSYKIPDNLKDVIDKMGMRVTVPFGRGNRLIEGYVIGFSDDCGIEDDKIKYISNVLEPYPVISEKRIKLAEWMQEEYYATLSDCMQCIIPKKVKSKTYKCVYIDFDSIDNIQVIDDIIKKNNKQSSVLRFLKNGDSVPVSHIRSLLGIDTAPINALIKKGIVKTEENEIYRGNYNSARGTKDYTRNLTKEQENAVHMICNSKKTVLLKGVTGSGKTEVYLQVIEQLAIKKQKQAIVLVPEISLTSQTVDRFISRFGDMVAVTHSRMSDGERYDQWHRAGSNEISIMIGPRSAIFTPFEKLGVIIIDEEHESAYKADQQTPKFDAREVAIKLSQMYGCTVVLGSATPSVTSYYNASIDDYFLVEMKNRVNMQPPELKIIDMRDELKSGNREIFGRQLKAAIAENLENKKQTILFLNRRGYASFVSCRECGYVMTCKNCNVNYTYHKYSDNLMCHYCGDVVDNPKQCPSCGSEHIRSFGIGTQRVEQEILKAFPNARILRMDMDTTKGKNSHSEMIDAFRNNKADILIGTQMIAKGLDFPNVTLVGIIAADLSLNINDYHSGEVTYQLITQVAGRAGRADDKGVVYIQTYNPSHYSIQAALHNDYEGFYKQEISFRKLLSYPPFTNIFFVMFSGANEKDVYESIMTLFEIMKKYNRKGDFEVFAPTPAVISRINNKYRWRMMVKSQDSVRIKKYVMYTVEKLRAYRSMEEITISISLNPNYSF